MTKRTPLALIAFLFCAAPLLAQEGYEHFSVSAHGAGRTYVVSSFGLDAVGLNPALLYTGERDKKWEVRLFPAASFGVDAGPSFRDVGSISNIFDVTKGDINDADLDHIVSVLQDNKLSGRGDAEAIGVAYHPGTIGSFAFTWTAHAALRTDIPQDFLDFLSSAQANLAQGSGNYANLDVQGLWYDEYSISFGTKVIDNSATNSFLQAVQLGGAAKYVTGIGMIQLQDGNYFKHTATGGGADIAVNYEILSSYSNDFDPHHAPNHFSFDFLTASPAGSGFGLDLGGSATFLVGGKAKAPALLFGASVTDIGSISWKDHAKVRDGKDLSGTVLWESGGTGLTDSLKKFSGELRDTSFSTALPTMLRLGALLDLGAFGKSWGGFSPRLAMEFATGLASAVGSLKYPRLGAGVTLTKTGEGSALRLSGGFVIEKNASDITLGVGTTVFDAVSIDLATAHLTEFFKASKRLDIAVAIKGMF
jgi:hypothetical protein